MTKPTFGFLTWSLPSIKLRTLLFLLGLLNSLATIAQDQAQQPKGANCTQVLRLARTIYEQGRLHELENILSGCLAGDVGKDGAFATKQEKVDAYRFLCLAAIYLEEPTKADAAMTGILKTDHFFEPSNADPAEFKALYATFRTAPVISGMIKVGPNLTMPHILKYFPTTSTEGKGRYKPGVSFNVGVGAEKQFFPKAKMGLLRNSVLGAEVMLHSRSFGYQNDELFRNLPSDATASKTADKAFKYKSTWWNLNLYLRYRLNPNNKWDPYVGIGPSFNYLSKYRVDLPQTQFLKSDGETISSTATGPAVDVLEQFNKLATAVMIMGGGKIRLGDFYLLGEIRYQFGLNNTVNPENRTNQALTNDYGVTIHDHRQGDVMLMVGAIVPIFSPKKQTKK